jgi:hypothetical protein
VDEAYVTLGIRRAVSGSGIETGRLRPRHIP